MYRVAHTQNKHNFKEKNLFKSSCHGRRKFSKILRLPSRLTFHQQQMPAVVLLNGQVPHHFQGTPVKLGCCSMRRKQLRLEPTVAPQPPHTWTHGWKQKCPLTLPLVTGKVGNRALLQDWYFVNLSRRVLLRETHVLFHLGSFVLKKKKKQPTATTCYNELDSDLIRRPWVIKSTFFLHYQCKHQ